MSGHALERLVNAIGLGKIASCAREFGAIDVGGEIRRRTARAVDQVRRLIEITALQRDRGESECCRKISRLAFLDGRELQLGFREVSGPEKLPRRLEVLRGALRRLRRESDARID